MFVLLLLLVAASLCESYSTRAPNLPQEDTKVYNRTGGGGRLRLDVTDPKWMDKIWTGLASINAANESPNYIVPVKIVNGYSLVVSGMRYVWEVEMAETNCNKANTNFDRNTCVPSVNAPTSLYKVKLWEQPWLNYAEYYAEKI